MGNTELHASDRESKVSTDVRERTKQLESRYRDLIASFGPLFLGLEDSVGGAKPEPKAWSFLECMEHLSLTAEQYLSELEKTSFDEGSEKVSESLFSKWISALIENAPESKLKFPAPPATRPRSSALHGRDVCARLVANYESLLEQLRTVPADTSLRQTRVNNPFLPLLKFSLEQVFTLHLQHAKRHIAQGMRALEKALRVSSVEQSSTEQNEEGKNPG